MCLDFVSKIQQFGFEISVFWKRWNMHRKNVIHNSTQTEKRTDKIERQAYRQTDRQTNRHNCFVSFSFFKKLPVQFSYFKLFSSMFPSKDTINTNTHTYTYTQHTFCIFSSSFFHNEYTLTNRPLFHFYNRTLIFLSLPFSLAEQTRRCWPVRMLDWENRCSR